MAKNQRNITIASYSYLHEVQAIPKPVRKRFLQSLLERKGGVKQKRVMVLKVIYRYVDENTISQWNPQLICKTIGVSANMLYCHKSRLLKGLRELYFNWNEEEKIIEADYDTGKFNTPGGLPLGLNERTQLMEMCFAKARKMVSLGMMREAKGMYSKIIKPLMETLNLDIGHKNLLKTEIYEFFVNYYYNKRKKRELKYYCNKIDLVSKALRVLNQKVSPAEKALFDIRHGYSVFYLNLLEWYETGCTKIKNNNISDICRISKQYNYLSYYFNSLHHKAILEITGGVLGAAMETCLEGYYTAQREGKTTELYAFASKLFFLKTKTPVTNIKLSGDKILAHYRRVKETAPMNLWTIYLENSISKSYYPALINEIPEILSGQANTNTLLGDYSFAVYWKFIYSSELYHKDLLGYFTIAEESGEGEVRYLEMNAASPEITVEIERTCFNMLCYHKALSDIGLLWNVYILQLTVSFFRESDIDMAYSKHIISKIERLQKKMNRESGFELLELALKMLEHRGRPKYMLNRFEHMFKKMLDGYKTSGSEFGIIDYAIISSLARRLKCREITTIVKDFYAWLKDKHPEILAPVFKEIEEREAKIKVFDGSKGAA